MTLVEEWDRCKGWIEAALEYGSFGYDIEAVWDEIANPNSNTLLWPGKKSAVVTQLWIFPRARALNYWLAGGDLHELTVEMRPHIEAFAEEIGCTDIIMAGRPGWGKALGEYGYHRVWSAFRKPLHPTGGDDFVRQK